MGIIKNKIESVFKDFDNTNDLTKLILRCAEVADYSVRSKEHYLILTSAIKEQCDQRFDKAEWERNSKRVGKETMIIVWSLNDVKGLRPKLTDEQCMEVLDRVQNKHDAEWGVSWETLRTTADDMFPDFDDDDSLAIAEDTLRAKMV